MSGWTIPKLPAWPTAPGAHDAEVHYTRRLPDPVVAGCAVPEAPVLEIPRQRPMQKLGRTMMRSYAAKLLKTKQDGKCPLCLKEIDLTIKGEGVLDHDHDSGEIRGVLHRSCNAAEGKIANAAARWGAKSAAYAAIISYLENMVKYLKSPGAGMIYPMHKTVDEVKDARAAKAKLARAANKAKLAMRGKTQGN